MEVLNKIAPKSIQGFLGNKLQIKKINEHISSKSSYGTILYILGPDGCGKSTLCNLLFSRSKYNILEVSSNNFTTKDMSLSIQNFMKNKSIDSYFNTKPKLIIVDDIDILFNTDRGVLSTLIGFQQDFQKYKIHCIACCNQNEDKKIMELKKNAEIVKISYPQLRDVYPYLMDCDLGIEDGDLLKLVQKYRGSIRDIVMHISMNIKDCETTINFKDMNNFEVVNYIYKNGLRIKDINYVYKEDAGLVGFIMYENLCDELYYKKDVGRKVSNLINPYISANMYFIYSSMLESNIFESGNWKMYDLINILRINSITNLLTDIKDKKTPKDYKYRFSQTLSKISHKNIMNKKLKKFQSSYHLGYESLFIMSDIIISNNLKRPQKAEETNFINTYEKYFVS